MRDLTSRQLEVLELLSKGLTNPEIGGVLEIATGTVKHHVEAILEALEVSNRTEATSAYHALRGEGAREAGSATPGGGAGIPGFRGRPALAVLPFEALGGEPEDEVRADGVTEALIAALASWRWFPVIASGSSFAYRGRPRDLSLVGRELDVRYIVEGDLRRAGEAVRIRARLVDTDSGQQLWTGRCDGVDSRAFELEDEIAEQLATAIEPALSRVEWRRAGDQRPAAEDADALVRRGNHHVTRGTKEDLAEAQRLYRTASELDPGYAPAFTGLASSYLFQILHLVADSVPGALEQALEHAERGVALDDESFLAHQVQGFALWIRGAREEALPRFERAVELNPSSAQACWGLGAALQRPETVDESITWLERAIRLSPHDPLVEQFRMTVALSFLLAGRFEEAIDRARTMLRGLPDSPQAYDVLACAYGYLDRPKEAEAALKRMLELRPFSMETVRLLNSPEVVDCLVGGWRKAGLPGLD